MTDTSDPRKLGGGIVGPGGPYGRGDVLIDTTDSVLLDYCEVALMGAVRDGVQDEMPIVALGMHGRVNQTKDRVKVLFLTNEDGAAALVSQLIGIAARAGWQNEFMQLLNKRMEDMPTLPPELSPER